MERIQLISMKSHEDRTLEEFSIYFDQFYAKLEVFRKWTSRLKSQNCD